MKKTGLVVLILCSMFVNFGCDDDNPVYTTNDTQRPMAPLPSLEEYVNGGLPVEKLEALKIPDSLNTSLIIAVYDQELPENGRIILVYNDSTRSAAKKISYLKDSTAKTESLLKVRDDEFKSRLINETYVITPKTVLWNYNTSVLNTSYEYARLDNFN